MPFDIYDPAGGVRITSGNLPHWYQPGVTYFITFRTEDSVPGELLDLWYSRRIEWLRRNGIAPEDPTWRSQLEALPEMLQNDFHNTFSREFMEYLDRGLGECVLRRAELAKVVFDALLHFDNKRYEMGDFVVMPNHVHLLVCLLGQTDLEEQCYSWKKFTAGKINKLLGRKGRFWQEESFDHLVRSPIHFERFRRYIRSNPDEAGLRPGEYLHYMRDPV
jgi:REP element-mobilizing transposase RayT